MPPRVFICALPSPNGEAWHMAPQGCEMIPKDNRFAGNPCQLDSSQLLTDGRECPQGAAWGGGGDMVFPLYTGPQGFDLTPLMGESIAFGKTTLHRGGANDMLQSGIVTGCQKIFSQPMPTRTTNSTRGGNQGCLEIGPRTPAFAKGPF